MEVVNARCCGLDVHKKSITACALTPEGKEIRKFGSTTGELLELADWITGCGVIHIAMESTGVFWKPVYNLLERMDMELLVVNAQHIRRVPGRKTDVSDAEWIASLLRHGLVRGSYIPDRPQRELRELARHRRSLIRERAQTINRIQKTLEGGNIKLSSVASDIVGVSGRAILDSFVAGGKRPKDPGQLGQRTPSGEAAGARGCFARAGHATPAPAPRKPLAAPGLPGPGDRSYERRDRHSFAPC